MTGWAAVAGAGAGEATTVGCVAFGEEGGVATLRRASISSGASAVMGIGAGILLCGGVPTRSGRYNPRGMKVGIIGLPFVGKSTLFQLLTGAASPPPAG